MEEVFKRFPHVGGVNGTDLPFGGLPDDIDPSKVNTTSVTKVTKSSKNSSLYLISILGH